MQEIIDFLSELRNNNNKEWFDANRSRWRKVQGIFNGYVEELIDGISSFDPSIKALTAKDCTYRLNRDVRFSPDKSPYKCHLGAFIAPRGKKSGRGGYYLHIEPTCDELLGCNLMSVGVYMPEPVILRSLRDEILDNGAEIATTIERAKGFSLGIDDDQLKRTPKGYPTDSEYDQWLKLKHLYIQRPISDAELHSERFVDECIAKFKTAKPFLDIVNRAVEFAYEEMI